MTFEKLLVAVDGSEASNRALDAGLELARLAGGSIVALAVEGPLPAYAATVGEVEEVRARARAAGIPLELHVRPGHAAELIPRVAKETSVDLIVLGRRGHFVRDHLLGSTADRVAEHAECLVMIVR